MKCHNCGAELEDDVLFCRECGAKVILQKRFCRECGASLEDGVKFCSNCGSKIEYPETISKYQSDDTDSFSVHQQSTPFVEPSTQKFSDRSIKSIFSAESMFKNVKRSNISSSKMPMLASVAGVFILLLLAVLLLSKGGFSKPSNNDVKDSTSVNNGDQVVTDNTIEKGTEYACMTGQWDVYIATAISDSLIQVENWNKSLSSDKSVKHEYDLGSFKINDPDNEFRWIDDEHTAFSIRITDKNQSGYKKGNMAIFTIDISSKNDNKGSDYNKEIASYVYINDGWHMYRAISLTPSIVKIELWQRGLSTDLSPYLFGRDVCVIDTTNTDTDFEWTDDEHTAFTITMKDPENKYYWKKETFVAFTLENEKYKYPDVISFLGKSVDR